MERKVKMTYAIGIMSGTSLDGVDAALVNITGVNEETEVELIAFETLEIPQKIDRQIRKSFSVESSSSPLISSLNVELGELFADAAFKVSKAAKIDRKSTRLNSSHVSISYAVFCLKKKRKEWSTVEILSGHV